MDHLGILYQAWTIAQYWVEGSSVLEYFLACEASKNFQCEELNVFTVKDCLSFSCVKNCLYFKRNGGVFIQVGGVRTHPLR